MRRPYSPYIPRHPDELRDKLAAILLSAPKCEDESQFFAGKNVHTEFAAVDESLNLLRADLGDDLFKALAVRAGRAKGLFLADPDDSSGQSDLGREIILEMEYLLRTQTGT